MNKEELKQETPEEAAIIYAHNYFDMHETNNYKALKQGFNEGAKWQQERSYSDEEVYKLTLEALDLGMRIRQDQSSGYSEKSGKELHKEWFVQFKKKQDEQRRNN